MSKRILILLAAGLFVRSALTWNAAALTPPVVRSTTYDGTFSNIVHYAAQPWMNSGSVAMTAEAWVYCNDLSGNQALVARHYSTNFYFGLNGNHLRFYRGGGTSADSDGTLAVRRWTHVAATYDGTYARFYINGNAAGTKVLANTGNQGTNSLSIGGQYDVLNLADVITGGFPFNGQLDEVRLWSVARSSSQIAANMYNEVRSGTGLLATFGSGGGQNDIRAETGATDGVAVGQRWSGFGILPSALTIPHTTLPLAVDANIDLLNEYRGAEVLALRSTTSATRPDVKAYLMVSTNASNYHLYIGVPDLEQVGAPIPTVEIMGDVNPDDGNAPALGDWDVTLSQDTFQGGRKFGVIPPLITTPTWLGWGQSATTWQALTAESFEFHQNYEFRVHGDHLNAFTNDVGLLVRYYDYDAGGDQLVGPIGGRTDQPATFARVNWGGPADSALRHISIFGVVTNVTLGANESGWTVSLRSGASALSGDLIRSIPVSPGGTFSVSGYVPAETPYHLLLQYRSGYTILPPEFSGSGKAPVSISGGNTTLTYSPCYGDACTMQYVRYRVQSPPGPLSIASVTPTSVTASVPVRTSPAKTTGGTDLTITGANLTSSARVYFRGSGCALDPPNLCTSDFIEASVVSTSFDRTMLVASVPELPGAGTSAHTYQIVVENPSYLSTGGSHWNYGPTVTVSPPVWPKLYGFEFKNMDDGPSWQEFEAVYGDSIFATLPFTDIPIPGVRRPYYGLYFLVYMGWMEAAHGSCSGFAATSRLMADGDIPAATFDRADNGDGIHGVLLPSGYVGHPACDVDDTRLCAPKPPRWTGFDLFRPYRPINLWGRITSLQGVQTSAEFLNIWIGQLHRPIASGPRRGISVGDPVLVLDRVRTDPAANLITLGSRDFGSMHTITPYGVLDDQALMPDLLTPTPQTGFSLIRVYDSNWPERERFLEVDRSQNTFRYLMGFNSDGSPLVVDGAGLYYSPMSVYRGRRHALGPRDIAANVEHFIRVLQTGTSSSSFRDGEGRTAGWTDAGLVNEYDGAMPFVPPAFVFGQPDRFDSTMFFLPETNAPAGASFVSRGGNVLLHYALGGGDILYGFNGPDTGASNSVDGILIGLNEGLLAVGLHAAAPVEGFGAMVSSRDGKGGTRLFVLDSGAGASTPDVQLERDGFKSLTIRNRSGSPFGFRLNVAGTGPVSGAFEHAYDFYSQPAHSTLVIRLPENPAAQMPTRELDANNDGTAELIEDLPADGQLRISSNAGLVALRWRQLGLGESLERATKLAPTDWTPTQIPVKTDGADQLAEIKEGTGAEFYRLRLDETNCLDLSAFAVGSQPNPWETGGFKFEAYTGKGTAQPQNAIATVGEFSGLEVLHTVNVQPLDDCESVTLEVSQLSGLVTFEAVGPLGTVIARETLTDTGSGPQTVTLGGFRNRISFVRVTSPNAQCVILDVCCGRLTAQTAPPYASCVSFANEKSVQQDESYTLGDVVVSVTPGPVVIDASSGLGGNWLKLAGEVDLKFATPSAPCDRVTLTIRDLESSVTATAYDADDNEVATAGPPPGSATPQDLVLEGAGIVRVVVKSNSDKAVLQDICCSRAASQ